MTYSNTCNNNINQTLNISLINKNMNDEDPVYLHDKSIIVASPEETLCKTQVSLAKQLTKKLDNAGRKSLAERTIKKQFISYKELKSLVYQINQPRTLQTLLANRYLQWSINLESFPDFVKNDMIKNNILALPSDIYDLSQTISSSKFPLVLLKYISTQCMEIDYNSRFEVLEEECEDCIQQFLKYSLSVDKKESLETIKYIANLGFLRTKWKQQDPEVWNRLTQPTTAQSCVSFPSETSLSDNLNKSKVLDSNTRSSRQKAETTKKETINNPPHEPLITPSKSTIHEKITEPQLLMFDKEQGEDVSKPKLGLKRKSKKSRKKTKHSTNSKDYLEPSQILLESPQETITKVTTPLPENNPSETSLAFQEERPKEALPPLLLGNNSNETSLTSSQGARPKERAISKSKMNPDKKTSLESQRASPKERTTQKSKMNSDKAPLKSQEARPNTRNLTIDEILEIDSHEKLSMSAAFSYQKITNIIIQKTAVVLDYINNPKNEDKLNKAKKVLNEGPWYADQYFDLLEKAYEVSELEFFSERLGFLIKNLHFYNGYPPQDMKTGKTYLKTKELEKTIGTGLNYYYVLADDVTPSEAMDGCMIHLWFITQETQILYSCKIALREHWNDDRLFDYYFSKKKNKPAVFSMMPLLVPMELRMKCRVLDFFEASTNTDISFMPGYLYVFENHSSYKVKHLNGDYHSLFAFCTSVKPIPHFITSCSSTELTVDGIQDTLVDLYNKKSHNEKFMTGEKWQKLMNIFQRHFLIKSTPTITTITTITKESLLSDKKNMVLNKLSIRVNFELADDIKSTHLKYMNKARQRKKIR